jgi:phytoene desaturase
MAIRLAAKGYAVDVFEKNEFPGGKIRELRIDGYRFDAGPSLFTLPNLVTELFELHGEDPSQYFKYTKLDALCNYFFDDGVRYQTYTNIKKTAVSLAKATGEDAQLIVDFLNENTDLYNLTSEIFIENSLSAFRNFIKLSFISKLFKLGKLNMNETMYQSLRKYFKTEKLIQHFSRYATYNGSDPGRAPATLNLISSLEYNLGAYLPEHGMHDITTSLVALAERKKVVFHYKQPVTKILHDRKKITGIQVGNESLPYHLVVSNSDIHFVYNELLDGIKKPNKILSQERSSSVLVFNWGIKKTFDELGLHNIFFAKDHLEEFNTLFAQKKMSTDATIYIFISSKLIPADAPEGCENWFVLLNAPAATGLDWKTVQDTCRKQILDKLSSILNQNVESLIQTESILDPKMVEDLTSSYQGALYGNSSNNKMAAFLRHSNRSRQLKNLYFVGGSVHPGGGIPLCLSSAKIVDKWIKPA